jgi:hypothetical protein
MSQPPSPSSVRCPGPRGGVINDRRTFLQAGLAGFASLSLPGILRLRSQGLRAAEAPPAPRTKKAVIMVWQPGGLSHLDSYDPKPNSGSEYRGPFGLISTKVPGMQFTELLPRQAAIADKLTVLRSMRQTAGGHPAGSMQLLSGDPDTRDKPKPRYPDWMSVANYLRAQHGPRQNPLPAYVGINPPLEYNGPAYLGDAYSPFTVNGDPNAPNFTVPNIGLSNAGEVRRLQRRTTLRQNLDDLQRAFDQAGETKALDEFESQALTLLTSAQTKEAFDLSREDDATRDRYGRNQWGQQLLLARRLVEAGVDVLTTSLKGPLCGRVQNWDDHAVNHNVFEAMRFRADVYDQAVTALIEDIHERGLDERVLVVVTGEFGRTPKISYPGPGREHWADAGCAVFFGGGLKMGQVIGETDSRAERSKSGNISFENVIATIYRVLGIDLATTLNDFNGRPQYLLDDRRPIRELVG